MRSACLCSPGSLQLSLEPLTKPSGKKLSAGAGGALPPRVLLHSQLVGTEEGSHGKRQGYWHLLVKEKQKQKARQPKQGAGREQSNAGLSSPNEGKAMGCRRCTTPPQWQWMGVRKGSTLQEVCGEREPADPIAFSRGKSPKWGFVGHVPAVACRDGPFCRRSTCAWRQTAIFREG